MPAYAARAEFRRAERGAPWVLAGVVIDHRLWPARDGVDPIHGRLPDAGLVGWADVGTVIAPDAPAELVKSLSNEQQVTEQTPPCFLWHTWEDKAVPPENSVVFYSALLAHKVPGELHLYEKGRHGVGLGQDIPGTAGWPAACSRSSGATSASAARCSSRSGPSGTGTRSGS